MKNKQKNKSMRCQIAGVDGKRRNFKFDVSRKDTLEGYKKKLKGLVLAKRLGDIPTQDMNWIADQDDAMKMRLAKLGVIDSEELMPKKALCPTIQAMCNVIVDLKTNAGSKRKMIDVRNKLVAFFGVEKRLDEVTALDAQRFCFYLTDKEHGCGLEPHSTARRHNGYCVEIWQAAIRDKILEDNPFVQKAIKTNVKTNKDRHFYITPDISRRMYAVINNDEYKLRFVLMRYAGLRSPSEINALKWSDIDFEKSEMTVRSPKTQHHDDRGIRRLPIFPEVRDELNKAWDKLAFGSDEEYVVPRISNHTLRKHVLRWIGTIGVDVWPQLLINFRRSARTEKANEYAAHILNAWFGHSEEVSQDYLMDMEDNRIRAAEKQSALSNTTATPERTSQTLPIESE